MAYKSIDPFEVTKDYARNLKNKIKIEKIILFGSAGRNQMTRDSDLDIIIISPDFEKMPYIDRLIFLSKARGSKFTFVPMDIFGYTQKEFAKLAKESVVLAEAQKEGKVVSLK